MLATTRYFHTVPLCALLLMACGTSAPATENSSSIIMDAHSNARPNEAVITHLHLDIRVDMEQQRISGTAAYKLARKSGAQVVFDTDGLVIEGVSGGGKPLAYTLGDSSLIGRALRVDLPDGVDSVVIAYHTTEGSKALQWLAPVQTAGKEHPFLFTQGQAILGRSWIPVQDSPGIRFTYSAAVQVPAGLMALMSAENPQQVDPAGRYTFRMEQPVPAYLLALAVGDIAFKPLGKRTGVYAEPVLLDTAAWELADTERMVEAAEALYGPYRWGRYDVLFLPPSFPFGGMENPVLTFATPTILAGDRSLNALIAHELAHSWSGNLVTNSTWDDFWLNEGFTVYFEHRIIEALYGADYNAMTDVLGHQDLERTFEEIAASSHPEDSHLRLKLAGRDPDDGMTDIAYEKGYAFLKTLERKVGREKFDAFLRGYFEAHAFKGITTDAFTAYLNKELIEPNKVDIDLVAWIDGPGLPADAEVPVTDRFTKVEAELARWEQGTPANKLSAEGWTTFERIHFLRSLPQGIGSERMQELDQAFGFSATGNAEVLAAWLEQCILQNYTDAYPKLREFLVSVGRRKFLTPLYGALVQTPQGRSIAEDIYRDARPNYHSVAVASIDALLAK